MLPGNIIRLVFQMNKNQTFRYKSGQYVCICIPEISWFEWHPLSISTSPHEEEFAIHFSVMGQWTQKVKNAILTKGKEITKTRKSMFGTKFQSTLMKIQSGLKKDIAIDSKVNQNFNRGFTKFFKQSKKYNY